MKEKRSYVYILFNRRNGTLYTGVTSDLIRRVHEHKEKQVEGFTAKYGVDKLGYFHEFDDVRDAIVEEKRIKAGSREQKIKLIEAMNPNWDDLSHSIVE